MALLEPFCCSCLLRWPSAPEIKQYFLNFQAKYGLEQYVKLRSRVISAEWNEEEGKYHLYIETPEGPKQDWCHVLINGSGVLNNWKCWCSVHHTLSVNFASTPDSHNHRACHKGSARLQRSITA